MQSGRKSRAVRTLLSLMIFAVIVTSLCGACALRVSVGRCSCVAYSNVTPPTLPEYDTSAYSHAVIVFNYEAGAEDWYQVHLYYSGTAFTHNGSCVTNAEGVTRKDIYGDGSWTGELTVEAAPELAPGMNGEVYQRIWTNHDILRDDGTVYLAAITATPAFDLRSFKIGLALGLAGKPVLIGGQRAPVAYLYNGVQLPKLPEWDESVYKYVYVVTTIYPEHPYHIYFQTAPWEPHGEGSDGFVYVLSDCTCMQYLWEPGDEAWTYFKTSNVVGYDGGLSSTGNVVNLEAIVWGNTDVYAKEGTLYLAASDPVPVYE